MVCANGAMVWDARSDEVLRQIDFDPAALFPAITRFCVAMPDTAVAVLSAERMFLDERYAALRRKGAGDDELISDLGRTISEHRIVLVGFRHPRFAAEQLLPAASVAFAGVGTPSFAGIETLDVVPIGVTKAVTVGHLLSELGCQPGATAVFGDMPSDLPLFEWFGWAAAVANAHPLVLEAADEVVPSNDDDGVARTLRRLFSL